MVRPRLSAERQRRPDDRTFRHVNSPFSISAIATTTSPFVFLSHTRSSSSSPTLGSFVRSCPFVFIHRTAVERVLLPFPSLSAHTALASTALRLSPIGPIGVRACLPSFFLFQLLPFTSLSLVLSFSSLIARFYTLHSEI